MPTAKLFSQIPPFPDNVPTANLGTLSFTKLLSNDQTESEELFRSCQEAGFFQLDLHGSPEGEALLREAEELFELNREVSELSTEEKMKYVWNAPKSLFGYKPPGSTKIETGSPDRYEFYNISQDDILGTTTAPPHPHPVQSRRPLIKSYLLHAHAVVSILLSHLDTHLHLPPGTLSSLQRPTHPSGASVRLLRYAPQPPHNRRTSLSGHTDIGTVTLLFNVAGGLQILPPTEENSPEEKGEEGNWRYVRPQLGCAVVNLGDAMVQWTGGVLRSNLHRVTYAPGAQAERVRYSVAYFARPESSVSMRRLKLGGSVIPLVGEGDEGEVECDAEEWHVRKAKAIAAGGDCARSRGGKRVVSVS